MIVFTAAVLCIHPSTGSIRAICPPPRCSSEREWGTRHCPIDRARFSPIHGGGNKAKGLGIGMMGWWDGVPLQRSIGLSEQQNRLVGWKKKAFRPIKPKLNWGLNTLCIVFVWPVTICELDLVVLLLPSCCCCSSSSSSCSSWRFNLQCLSGLTNSVLTNHPGLTNRFLTSNIFYCIKTSDLVNFRV